MLQSYMRNVETGYLVPTPAGQYILTVTESFYVDSAGQENHQATTAEVVPPVRRGRHMYFNHGDLDVIERAIDVHAASLAAKQVTA